MKGAIFTLNTEANEVTIKDIFPPERYLVQSVIGPAVITQNDHIIYSSPSKGFEWYKVIGDTELVTETYLVTNTGILRIEDRYFRLRLEATSSIRQHFPTYEARPIPANKWLLLLSKAFPMLRRTLPRVPIMPVTIGEEILQRGSIIGAKILSRQ